ncbi:ribonuclease H [Ranunculus cassubicifolius]
MSKKYAVYEGRNPGVYDTWQEAKAQVDGYSRNCHEKVQPSGESYSKPYVVYDGNKPGVYDNWRAAHSQVSGYPGARYEKSRSFGEAESKFQGSQGSSTKKGYY